MRWVCFAFVFRYYLQEVSLSLSHSTLLYTLILSLRYLYTFVFRHYTSTNSQYAFLHICRRCLRFDLCLRCCPGLEPGSRLRCTASYSSRDTSSQLMNSPAPLLRHRRPGLRLLSRRHKVPVHHRPRRDPEVHPRLRTCALQR
jgi:hypothetical protein